MHSFESTNNDLFMNAFSYTNTHAAFLFSIFALSGFLLSLVLGCGFVDSFNPRFNSTTEKS